MNIDLTQLAQNMTGDEAGRLNADDAVIAVRLALLRYSTDRPRTELSICPVQPDGHALAVPESWEEGSRVVYLECPAGQAQLTAADWEITETLSGPRIRLRHGVQPGPGVNALVRYTVAHTEASVPPGDLEAVAHWAAALMLDQLASLYSGDKQSTIDADAVDHAGRGNTYASRAAEHRKLYFDHLGVDPKRTVAAGTTLTIGNGGLLHGRPQVRPIR